MTRSELISQIQTKRSFLCIGLDTDIDKIPRHLLSSDDPVFEFNKQIIDSTKDLCIGYKINTAFYECRGLKGWESMEKTVHYIPSHFKIADGKRGDIGNTSSQYAKAFFDTLPFDAITVNPYMGSDSVMPFLEYEDKWTILLALTSNPGASDFEMLPSGQLHVYEHVLKAASTWGTTSNLMFVVGATQSKMLKKIRELVPRHFFLVPGVGSQGGNLEEVVTNGKNADVGLIINVSRDIIYASDKEDFAQIARLKAMTYQQRMTMLI